MAEVIEWIVKNGWIIDITHKMWRKQNNILKLSKSKTIRSKKITEYYELNKHRLPQSDDLKWLLQYNSRKCHCGKSAVYNWGRYNWPIRCKLHKEQDMVDIVSKRCKHLNCTTRPTFGKLGKSAEYCKDHKEQNMVNVVSKRCKHPNCKRRPTFGKPGCKVEYCKDHKEEEMVDINNKRCKHPNCIIQPTFGKPGKKAEFCKNHKEQNMVNVVSKRCKHLNCNKRSTFGKPGSKAQYCKNHKEQSMINVRSKRCKHPNCIKQPIFGKPGCKAQYCKDHKEQNMINVKIKLCKHPNCNTRPNFGKPGTIAEYCKDHKLQNMVDVVNKQCKHPNCNKRPNFGKPGSKVEYCKDHKLQRMVNVVSKRCKQKGCTILAGYGTPKSRKQYCVKHAKEHGCFKVISCQTKGCTKAATWNTTNSYPAKRCYKHRITKKYAKANNITPDIALYEQECKKCKLDWLLYPNGLCDWCNSKKSERVEITVLNQLSNHFEIESSDSIIIEGCSKRRPDIVIACGAYKIIVEVDEHQHKPYKKIDKRSKATCEIYRMFQIHQDFGGSQILFIRFNPHNYKGGSVRLNTRLDVLVNWIKRVKRTYPKLPHPIEVVYFYYDGWDGTPIMKPLDYEELGFNY
jgi:hypothetical protein